jgi:hypothetical protein
MRHLLFATAMFVFGLGVTLGTASVLRDIAVIRGKSTQGDRFEVDQLAKPAMKLSTQSQSQAADTPHDLRL